MTLKFENIILRCIIFSIVSHNETESSALWDTMEKIILLCGIQRKKNYCVVGYNRRKFVKYPEIIPFSTPQ
jgi:hypothetical protein